MYKMSDLIFDIGANIGKWTIQNTSNNNKIIAVEASKKTYMELVKIENYKIICLNYAVCDSPNEYVEFYDCDTNTISTLNEDWLNTETSRFYKHDKYNKIMVPVISIDTLIEKYGKPNLIKIDVEGAEDICVKSLSSKVDSLCFEWAAELDNVFINTITHLDKIGFTKYHIQYCDNYTYRPSIYEYNSVEVINKIKSLRKKIDWGMCWAI